MEDFWLKISDFAYHRNGVGGRPFWLVDFVLHEEDSEDNLWAIVPQAANYSGVYVIDPDAIGSKWRGDEIGERLINLMLTMEEFDDFELERGWDAD